jgi:Zn-dependent protease with chaperone function
VSATVAALENYLVFGACFGMLGLLMAGAAREASRRGWWRPHPRRLAGLYTSALVAPPVAAAWLVTAALLPDWLGHAEFEAGHSAPAHALHLVGDLTAALEPGLAYLLLAVAFSAALFVIVYGLTTYRRLVTVLESVDATGTLPTPAQAAVIEATASRHGLKVGIVLARQPLSFVWGFRRSRVVLSSGLLDTLSPAQLAGVLEHEAAHHQRRDNLIKLALSVCAWATLAAPLSRVLLRWRAEQVELVCDEMAAVETSEPLDIAEALVALRRRMLNGSGLPIASWTSPFVARESVTVERRVRRLVGLIDQPPHRLHPGWQAGRRVAFGVGIAVLLGVLIVVTTYAPLVVHSTTESLLRSLR